MKKNIMLLAVAGLLLAGCATTENLPTGPNNQTDNQSGAQPDSQPDNGVTNSDSESNKAPEGTRMDPFALGEPIEMGDWTVTVNSFNPDATKAILEHNQFNDHPDEGTTYAMVNLTAQYNGEDSERAMMIRVDYVQDDGTVASTTDKMIVEPDGFSSMTELFTSGSTTGNVAFQISGPGKVRVKAGLIQAVEAWFLTE